MASPQLENGYLKIANEIYEAFAKTRITSEPRRILDFILRKTYGFSKKEDAISLSQFCGGTGLKKNSVCRSLKQLLEHRFILKRATPIANKYRFNKDFTTWIPFSKERHVSNERKNVLKRENNRSQTRDIQKTVTKENNNRGKEILKKYREQIEAKKKLTEKMTA